MLIFLSIFSIKFKKFRYFNVINMILGFKFIFIIIILRVVQLFCNISSLYNFEFVNLCIQNIPTDVPQHLNTLQFSTVDSYKTFKFIIIS
jgi:hypothetical protein